MRASRQTCGAAKADGSPCPVAFALCPDCGLCYHHDPHRAEERRAARVKGGNVSKQRNAEKHGRAQFKAAPAADAPGAPETVEDAKRALSWLSHAVLTGTIGPAVARDSATVLREFIKAVEKADLEAGVAELREQVAKLREERGRG
jgi:hypothetical protein